MPSQLTTSIVAVAPDRGPTDDVVMVAVVTVGVATVVLVVVAAAAAVAVAETVVDAAQAAQVAAAVAAEVVGPKAVVGHKVVAAVATKSDASFLG